MDQENQAKALFSLLYLLTLSCLRDFTTSKQGVSLTLAHSTWHAVALFSAGSFRHWSTTNNNGLYILCSLSLQIIRKGHSSHGCCFDSRI